MTRGVRPYYVPVGNEEQVFTAAFRQGLSILLKGPTGCGKTRFVEAMAYDLDRPLMVVLVILVAGAVIGLGLAFVGLAYHHHRRHHEFLKEHGHLPTHTRPPTPV